jgi:acetylornithine aminotransferase
VCCAAAQAVLRTIAADGLLDHAARLGKQIAAEVTAQRHPLVGSVSAAGLLIGIGLTSPVAAGVVTAARNAGFLVNAAVPDRVRLAPPLVLTEAQAREFLSSLPAILDRVQ